MSCLVAKTLWLLLTCGNDSLVSEPVSSRIEKNRIEFVYILFILNRPKPRMYNMT
jgi:hypothetical protein